MSGLTGLVDTLLAAKLSQRLDLLDLKSAAVVAGPAPAVGVQEVGNDVRLLSRAALDRQMATGSASESAAGAHAARPHVAGSHAAAPPHSVAQAASEDRLSRAGRLIGSVLTEIRAQAGPVRGAAPLWPSSQAAAAPGMVRALADAVSTSGVFYESHLLEFARGLIPRSQLQQEPQAAWPVTAGESKFAPPVAPNERGAAAEANADADESPIAAAPARDLLEEGVHPQAVRLVHQQLDLLASGAFRWSGEAWPGVPLEWSIHEEAADHRADLLEQEDASPRWATTLSLVLPRLGALRIHLSLRDSDVKAELTASDPATLSLLRAEGAELARRLDAAGLLLQELQIAPGAAS